ncbi:RNA polymerase sigma factor [Pricia sp.]|uniref:RNA polymerase sigma factor n=1 Tax=Pricia sp. TaxID=2268138 RepID=UPI00359480D8
MDLNFVIHQNFTPKRTIEELKVKSPTAKILDDSQLWHEFQAGDEIAFSSIYRLHAPLLYSYGMKLVKDKELIKDCIQDLYIELWNTKHRLGSVKNIKSYLHKSIRRKLIATAIKNRKKLGRSIKFPDYKIIPAPSEEFKLIEEQINDEKQDKLKEALNHLTQKQREIIHLKFFSRLDYSEISETMGISMKGTYKLMGRSINYLRNYMS